ncbi:uncharacterized protein LOC135399231 [Ornithodoros turicata]|uniref:uncharacterized protein LOC135399231 n=1 Tax=Ornithodoros turicata TaxID=34597 RepID=UPI003139016C
MQNYGNVNNPTGPYNDPRFADYVQNPAAAGSFEQQPPNYAFQPPPGYGPHGGQGGPATDVPQGVPQPQMGGYVPDSPLTIAQMEQYRRMIPQYYSPSGQHAVGDSTPGVPGGLPVRPQFGLTPIKFPATGEKKTSTTGTSSGKARKDYVMDDQRMTTEAVTFDQGHRPSCTSNCSDQ